MRTGADGLAMRVQDILGRSPGDGSAYAFRSIIYAPVTSTPESTPGPLPEWAAAKLAAL
jgi:hypothetical protein